jgi:hypothetical protein
MSSAKWLVIENIRQVFKECTISITNSPFLHLNLISIDLPQNPQWRKIKTMLFYELQTLIIDLIKCQPKP